MEHDIAIVTHESILPLWIYRILFIHFSVPLVLALLWADCVTLGMSVPFCGPYRAHPQNEEVRLHLLHVKS